MIGCERTLNLISLLHFCKEFAWLEMFIKILTRCANLKLCQPSILPGKKCLYIKTNVFPLLSKQKQRNWCQRWWWWWWCFQTKISRSGHQKVISGGGRSGNIHNYSSHKLTTLAFVQIWQNWNLQRIQNGIENTYFHSCTALN